MSLLLATDLTARSDRPTDRALLMADQLSAPVVLLHVVESEGDGRLLEERARQALESAVGEKGQSVEILIRRGQVDREILSLARERSASLIITGVARFNSIRDYVLGTAVDHLVRHSPVPVLIVKRRARKPYRRPLVATDFSPSSTRALEAVAAMFPETEIAVWHFCHAAYEGFLNPESTVLDLQREAESDMQQFLASAELPTMTRERLLALVDIGRDLWSQADKAVHDGDHDMLVLGTHGRSGVAQATIGSRAAELLQYVDCDVLMVPPATRQ